MQISVTWLGPVVAIGVVFLLWKIPGRPAVTDDPKAMEAVVCQTCHVVHGFGPGLQTSAPQAQALNAAIDSVIGGDVPYEKYATGAALGAALSATGIGGLGVLVGLSMYLPFMYILTFGIGCILNMILSRLKGPVWCEETGVPFAAGLIVGESMMMLIFAMIKLGMSM